MASAKSIRNPVPGLPLGLTSPHSKGPAVQAAQSKLILAGFLAGRVDGEFGPDTARACRSAKFWLGYPLKMVQGPAGETYGAFLDAMLDKLAAGEKLPQPYRLARATRIAVRDHQVATGTTVPLKTLANMRAHACPAPECKEDPPNSNIVSWASVWYGVIGAWCAMGFTRCAVDAGSKSFKRGEIASYVPTIVHYATVGLYGFRRTYTPGPGSGVCFDWDGDGVYDHVEIVDSPPASLALGAAFTTVGCNTSPEDAGDQSNGGACATKHRTVLPGGQTFFFLYS